jgi:circadian clock protein KaiC
LAGACGGESCLYVTFSETSEELSAVARSHGWSLDGIGILELSDFAQQLTAEAESTLFDPADIELHDVTKIVFAEVERITPTSRFRFGVRIAPSFAERPAISASDFKH